MNEKYTENVRVRLTVSQKKIVDTIAQRENISSSDVIRHGLFDGKSSSSYSIMIQNNLFKNEVVNTIQSMDDISKNDKEKIIKKVNTIGQCNLKKYK